MRKYIPQKHGDMLFRRRFAVSVLELLVYCHHTACGAFGEGSAVISGVFYLLNDLGLTTQKKERGLSVLTLAFFAILSALSRTTLSPGKGRPVAASIANSSAAIDPSRICMRDKR